MTLENSFFNLLRKAVLIMSLAVLVSCHEMKQDPMVGIQKEAEREKERRENPYKGLLERARKLRGPIIVGDLATSEDRGVPTVYFTIANSSDKTADAIKISIHCYNNFEEPVIGPQGTNVISLIHQKPLKSKIKRELDYTLYGFEATRKFSIIVTAVHFTDGETWQRDEQE